MGRGKTTISNELNRNAVSDEYVAAKAQTKAAGRRKAASFQGKKIVRNPQLREFVDRALIGGQSPEAIAGRLKAGLEPNIPYVSRDTVEEYIRSAHGRQIEYELKVLKAGQKKHRRRRRNTPERTVGDLEVDFIVSGKEGKGYCLTAADRKLRVGFIRKVLPVSVCEALRALQEIKRVFPELQSISTDNDILWNYNKQARHYVKKGSDISQYSDQYLQMVETKLNSRYMAVLGYQTPTEALVASRKEKVSRLGATSAIALRLILHHTISS